MPFPLVPVLLGSSLGLSLYDMFNRPRQPSIDISGELSRIRGLYDDQRAYAKQASQQQLQDLNRLTASNLAGRGIYSSPVSEYSFGANATQAQRSLASALAGIGAGEAGQTSALLERLTELQYSTQQSQYDRQARSRNMLISLLASAGTAGLYNQKNPSVPQIPSDPSVQYGPYAYGFPR